ncbi:hypothetical protein Hdeb2414_s0021g00577981 [Helianthus debilis subsp. tardiflorus]
MIWSNDYFIPINAKIFLKYITKHLMHQTLLPFSPQISLGSIHTQTKRTTLSTKIKPQIIHTPTNHSSSPLSLSTPFRPSESSVYASCLLWLDTLIHTPKPPSSFRSTKQLPPPPSSGGGATTKQSERKGNGGERDATERDRDTDFRRRISVTSDGARRTTDEQSSTAVVAFGFREAFRSTIQQVRLPICFEFGLNSDGFGCSSSQTLFGFLVRFTLTSVSVLLRFRIKIVGQIVGFGLVQVSVKHSQRFGSVRVSRHGRFESNSVNMVNPVRVEVRFDVQLNVSQQKIELGQLVNTGQHPVNAAKTRSTQEYGMLWLHASKFTLLEQHHKNTFS